MIIVSQDKKEIINFDNVKEIYIKKWSTMEKGKVVWFYEINVDKRKDYETVIGTYPTEERAKEVLQEIIEFLDRKSLVEMDEDGVTMQVLGNIYRMPKE